MSDLYRYDVNDKMWLRLKPHLSESEENFRRQY